MHVTSYNTADYLFFQGKIKQTYFGEHAMFFVDKETPGVHRPPAGVLAHAAADSHAIVRFQDVWSWSRTWSARRATAWTSRTRGSGTSG